MMTISVVHVASYLLFISSSRGYKLLAYNINYVQAYGVPSWKNGFYFGFRQRIICGQWEKSNLNERTFIESLMKVLRGPWDCTSRGVHLQTFISMTTMDTTMTH